MDRLLKTLAMAYQYPSPGSTRALWEQVNDLPHSSSKTLLEHFLQSISELKLAEREELHTRTLDLTPLTAPNVGYAVYGEDYRRGRFMAELNSAYREWGIDCANEIPDHLIPVLRYLSVVEEPLPELLQLLQPALVQIHHTLKTLEPKNPYLWLIEATLEAVKPLTRSAVASVQSRQLPLAMGSLLRNLSFWKGGNE
ncbi:nitrate reductase [uncultured Meiothermus sp.]|jgi:nitrate reductase delta subunit|uniref:nitrate reductase n=1 Tax=uncultured Meiothermus sp. TaxID=157471 RepID=UPI002628F228|nr:nitrate reductase [uncultured Meiothermus sp.]